MACDSDLKSPETIKERRAKSRETNRLLPCLVVLATGPGRTSRNLDKTNYSTTIQDIRIV